MIRGLSINDYDAVIFDLDGTIYEGTAVLEGAKEAVEFIRRNNKNVFFGTNNSSKSRLQIRNKLINMGIDCEESEIITSSYLAENLIKELKLENIYVFGSQSIIDECIANGISVSQTEKAKNLLIGYDMTMDYCSLTNAFRVAVNAEKIIACNLERSYPGEGGKLFPSCGGVVKAIEWCCNRECDYIVGKPSNATMDYVIDRLRVPASRVIVVGDSYDIDVAMALKTGATPIFINKKKKEGIITINNIKEFVEIF